MAKQHKPKFGKFKIPISRSPLELNFIEPLLLQQRSFEMELNWNELKAMDEKSLDDAINMDQLTFILFWNNGIFKQLFN